MDALAMVILTVPIIFPVIKELGFDPIWFGVIIVMTVELGLIHPPVGMVVFVIKKRDPGHKLRDDLRRSPAFHRDGPHPAGDSHRLSGHRLVASLTHVTPCRFGTGGRMATQSLAPPHAALRPAARNRVGSRAANQGQFPAAKP